MGKALVIVGLVIAALGVAVMLGVPLQDATGGYRAFRADSLRASNPAAIPTVWAPCPGKSKATFATFPP
jgi:hypothetical protein